ncbi:MAG TPA: RNase adapter RapZ [Nitrospiria bacterium]|nr:RNase adapter RapZ [Nitrospiria bacterium]HUK57526.1 RNase adapter RapZ [Nitrospiria bacterium]
MDLRLVIVSGLSGSGKTNALKCFEDLGYFCVDNLPPSLLPVFADLCTQSSAGITKVAVGIDIRERDFLRDFLGISNRLKEEGYPYELIFFEANDEVLVRRFSETRRPHPLAKNRPILEGIQQERQQLAELKKRSDRIIDTSTFTIQQLKDVIAQHYFDQGEIRKPSISVISFGYKYGIPYETDLLFDVRFLQNPNFVSDLKPLSGEDPAVQDYLFRKPEADKFIDLVQSFLSFLIPFYEKEGRPYLTVAIGCTGGRHRSVAIAKRLHDDLKAANYHVVLRHRDITRDR